MNLPDANASRLPPDERTAAQSILDARCARALAAYMTHGGEAVLGQAYDLGRRALAQGVPIPGVVAAHCRAVHSWLEDEGQSSMSPAAVASAATFLAEALAPYEMTHRGYHDALLAVRHLNETMEGEVRRIAHALHDEAGQLLVSVHLALAELEQALPRAVHPRLQHLGALLQEVERQLRNLSHELRPTVLDDLGWLAALQFLADAASRRARLAVQVRADCHDRLSPAVETALYRVVQEALANVVRHADARSVRIEVLEVGGRVRCDVVDDGKGFDPGSTMGSAGLGLRGMRERILAVGGQFDIDAAPGRGTRIRFDVPGGR